jgi:DNA primase
MNPVEEIKSRIDIVEIVSETVKLRRSGKSYSGLCPFHSNTRTPAFAVFPETGTWRCFSCNEGGDIFSFLMKKEGWDFATTLKYLAQKTGVILEAQTPEKKNENEHEEKLRTLLEEAVTFYHHHLLQTPAGAGTRAYLEKRGLTSVSIETFGLGYAPASWESISQYFIGKGYSAEDLIAAGLASQRQEGNGIYDRFRHRLMFPIRDIAGKMAGFGARALADEDMPKYLNSPQTELFDKSNLIYGLDLARKAIRQKDQAVLVEGYMDMIVLYQCGFTNTVSLMGTALNESQFRNLKRFTRRLILALDADAAGEKATLRGLEMARQAMDHSTDFVPGAQGLFDAYGLLRQEARLQADLRVTTLPAGKDPDEVALSDPNEWAKILEAAQPIVLHVMNTFSTGRNLDDPKVKSEIAGQVLPLIDDVPNPVERDTYRQRLARLLRVDERALLSSQPVRGSRSLRNEISKTRTSSRRSNLLLESSPKKLIHELEVHCLRILIRNPESLNKVDRTLQKEGLARLTPLDFEQTEHQILARLVLQSLAQDELEPRQFLQTNLPENLGELWQELMAPFSPPEPNENRLFEDLVRTTLRLRSIHIKESLEQLYTFQQDLQEQGEMSLASYQEMIIQYSRTREKLDHALNQPIQLD